MGKIKLKEIWKDIKGYEDIYQISNLGRVKSLSRCITRNIKGTVFQQTIRERILKQCKLKNGYFCVNLKKDKKPKTHYPHKLVAQTFLSKKDNSLIINHKDGDKTNNNVNNLEWVTYRQNSIHASENGLLNVKRGEQARSAKLKEKEVLEIMELHKKGNSNASISRIYGVDPSTISRIVNKIYWSHLWE